MDRIPTYIKPVILTVILVLLVGCLCKAAEFSADEVISEGVPGGTSKTARSLPTKLFTGRLYVKGDMERQEWVIGRSSGACEVKPQIDKKPYKIIIRIPSKGITWIVNPQRKTYTEHRFPPKHSDATFRGWKYIGNERIGGYECKKYSQIVNSGSEKLALTWWWSPKLKYALRTETRSPGGSTTSELVNIVVQRLPDSLFQLPKHYKMVPSVSRD